MVASSSVETVPGSIETGDAAYVYKGHLVLSFDDETAPSHGSVCCWLRRSGALTWAAPGQDVRVLDCQLAFADDKDFLNERFFLSTPSGQLVTATTKSAADRDAWLLALQLVLEKRATPSPAIVETSLSQRTASADAILARFRDWHNLLALQANDPLGLFKETRHWSRLGAKDKAAYYDLQAYMDGGAIDVCSLVAGLYTYSTSPFLFVSTLAQLAVVAESDVAHLGMYWPQILHWGFAHLASCQSMAMQLFYVLFLASVGRRSTVLALRTHWDAVAARTDGAKAHDDDASFGASLMQFYGVYVGLNATASTTEMASLVLGPTTSDHDAMQLLDQLLHTTQALRLHSRSSSVFGAWLGALTLSDVAAVATHLDANRFLPPFPDASSPIASEPVPDLRRMLVLPGDDDEAFFADLDDVLAEMPPENDAADALDVFSDTVHLVQSLVVASQNFKRQFNSGKDRKAHLPHVLSRLSLPLSVHDDTQKRVRSIVPTEGTVFSTKARAPTMVFFETIAVSETTTARHRSDPVNDAAPTSYLLDAFLDADLGRDRRLSVAGRSHSRSTPRPSEDCIGVDRSFVSDCPVALKLLEGEDDNDSSCNNSKTMMVVVAEANPAATESFQEKRTRLQAQSLHRSELGWDLVPVIAKSFDDMRQEVFIMQLLHIFLECFRETELLLRPYTILCCGDDCGLMQVLLDADSVSDVKKRHPGVSLDAIFAARYPTRERLAVARDNFIRSMAAYSLFCYILQIKDRHNGNVMLHVDGTILHIDFGFAFGIAPGGRFSFERAPFKLTEEMVLTMGGKESPGYQRFLRLLGDGLLALQHHASRILALVSMTARKSPFPCFVGQNVLLLLRRLQDRLCVGASDSDVRLHAQRLADQSCNSLRTRLYDRYQYHSNGYVS
ncbi:hypothetical protein SPRG_10078 [Saprolegnia parasitica CBS 223.65]|uniref:PI3K/PI4K catalytic domain-containing protein n=1 Tax=Saprolegnia parasitica (strain CBS 223.65) TaxID=695850 RepID=A0A067CAT3_SAPPC|nr:hypothetical protein SPRG_10078 [Saprolegnia parasitica CBS 223.65]KDO23932.1 hypothetical protein SPRG_10078 [Saprolegnia parasitica CBS 223.65]|eukprot:XP_012205397.1 hypothetical protein SPRG_10078 [Saprolegnia parasitica CBS 223.65]